MLILPIHYRLSRPVADYGAIKDEADKMIRFVSHGDFKGFYNKAFAIAHCQVSETPYAFFVVAPECIRDKMFEAQVIINPQIVEARLHKNIGEGNTVPNAIEYQEPCLSFPFRKPKTIIRYDIIKVSYQIKSWFWGLQTVERELSGIPSEIFQHEYDHCCAKNIYFDCDNPVKWWELLGNDKSKGGTSLDAPEDLGIKRTEERPNEDKVLKGYSSNSNKE